MKNKLQRWFRRSPKFLDSLSAYEQWASTYPPHAHNPLMELEQEAMVALFPQLHRRTVLDLACGTGRYGLIAQQKGAKLVIGIDNSPHMLGAAHLKKRALATMVALPLASSSIDVVLCGMALGHMPNIQPVFYEIARVLKLGGEVLISDLHPFMALNGAQRTFSTPEGEIYAVEHYIHLVSDYHEVAQRLGLNLTAMAEPLLPGKKMPVVLVMRFQKQR